MSRAFQNVVAAFHSLWEQRRRTALSALGIIVASMAIVLLISIATGVRADIGRQVEGLGVNLLVVLPGRIDEGSMFSPNLAGVSYLKDEDVARVRKVPGVRRATPLMFVGGSIRRGKETSTSTFLIAAGPEWFSIRPTEFSAGKPYGAGEPGRVCVIGSIAKEKLFGKDDAVGKSLEINGEQYKVLAVTVDKSADDSLFAMGGFENVAYIPYATAQKVVPSPQIHRIMIQTAPEFEPKELVSSVDKALGERLDHDTYSVLTQKDLLRLVFKVMSILTLLLTGLTSIALFVGGVGIMTVMLMSVNERAREIGIRKAVGARRSDIFHQFLAESVALAAIGGTVGLALSYTVCVILYRTTELKPMVTGGIVALSFAVSIVVGAVFGLLPAMRAASADPVDALRSE